MQIQSPLTSVRAREALSYKLTPKGERKAGLKFWIGRKAKTLFWCDLLEVAYDPDAMETSGAGTDDEFSEPLEKVELTFNRHTVIITGYRLWHLDDDCQNHLIDFIRVSSREAVMSARAGTREDPPVVLTIKIEKPEKKGR